MSTKPAKVAHRPSWPTKAANPGVFPETEDIFAKRSLLRGWTKVAKVGPPRARVKSESRADPLRLVPPGECTFAPPVEQADFLSNNVHKI